MDACRAQSFDPAHHDVFFQLEARNAVGQQPASAVVPVVDVDVITGNAEVFGRRQTARSSADNADRLAARRADRDRFDPALFPCGVGDVFFDRADGDGFVAGKLDHAIAFAQAVLRADAAADFGHRAGQIGQLIRLAQAAFRCKPQPVGDVVAEWAVDRAIGHAALRAARGLFGGLFGGVAVGDFGKILGAQFRLALLGEGLGGADKFEHGVFRHDIFSVE